MDNFGGALELAGIARCKCLRRASSNFPATCRQLCDLWNPRPPHGRREHMLGNTSGYHSLRYRAVSFKDVHCEGVGAVRDPHVRLALAIRRPAPSAKRTCRDAVPSDFGSGRRGLLVGDPPTPDGTKLLVKVAPTARSAARPIPACGPPACAPHEPGARLWRLHVAFVSLGA